VIEFKKKGKKVMETPVRLHSVSDDEHDSSSVSSICNTEASSETDPEERWFHLFTKIIFNSTK
jgi:hypothetical protein